MRPASYNNKNNDNLFIYTGQIYNLFLSACPPHQSFNLPARLKKKKICQQFLSDLETRRNKI